MGRAKSNAINSFAVASQHRNSSEGGFPRVLLSCPPRPCWLLLASPVKCWLLAPRPPPWPRSLHLSSPSCSFRRTQALRETAGERRGESGHQALTPATEEPPASPHKPAGATLVQAASTMNLEKAGKGGAGMRRWVLGRRDAMG